MLSPRRRACPSRVASDVLNSKKTLENSLHFLLICSYLVTGFGVRRLDLKADGLPAAALLCAAGLLRGAALAALPARGWHAASGNYGAEAASRAKSAAPDCLGRGWSSVRTP